jgi:tRNA (guanine-N7-)-methyltransferase
VTQADAGTADERAPAGGHPHIRSFSGRRGHFTSGQRLAYERLLPVWGVPYAPAAASGGDWIARAFGRIAPVVLEIGFGMGETTASIAAAHPGTDFLGVEVYPAGVGSLLRQIEERGLSNVRVIQHDAFDVVRTMIPEGRLAGIHVYFPDPWPKARHHKRRLVRPAFVALLATRLAPGGYLHCATDWEPYAEQMLDVLGAEPLLRNTAPGYAPRPEHRPLTKFERRGLRLGHGVRDLVFTRVSPAPVAAPDTPR